MCVVGGLAKNWPQETWLGSFEDQDLPYRSKTVTGRQKVPLSAASVAPYSPGTHIIKHCMRRPPLFYHSLFSFKYSSNTLSLLICWMLRWWWCKEDRELKFETLIYDLTALSPEISLKCSFTDRSIQFFFFTRRHSLIAARNPKEQILDRGRF